MAHPNEERENVLYFGFPHLLHRWVEKLDHRRGGVISTSCSTLTLNRSLKPAYSNSIRLNWVIIRVANYYNEYEHSSLNRITDIVKGKWVSCDCVLKGLKYNLNGRVFNGCFKGEPLQTWSRSIGLKRSKKSSIVSRLE